MMTKFRRSKKELEENHKALLRDGYKRLDSRPELDVTDIYVYLAPYCDLLALCNLGGTHLWLNPVERAELKRMEK